MKLWILTTSLTVSLLILSGCGGAKPAPAESAVVDENLPVITFTKNSHLASMNSIAFEWNAITDPKVKGIYVYKKSPSSEKKISELRYYETLHSRFKTHYLDSDVKPDTQYYYSFKTFSDEGESRPSKLLAVKTLPIFDSVAWIYSQTGMPRVAKILWRPHVNEKVESYIIERSTLEDDTWEEIATLKGRLNAEYIDEDLKDNYVYLYRIRAVTFDGIISKPSKTVKVVTKALPKSIVNIKATTNLAYKIKISWSPSRDEDFALYHLYRSDKIDGRYELIAKLHNNSFVDEIDEDSKTYFYRVSAVDKDSLESRYDQSSIQGMTLNKPAAPAIVEAKIVDNRIIISWSKTDPRAVKYFIEKTHQRGWFDKNVETFEDVKGSAFKDSEIEPNSTYTYVVYSIDKYGIKSEPSVAVKVVTPESTEVIVAPKEEKVATKVENPVQTEEPENVVPSGDDLDLSGL